MLYLALLASLTALGATIALWRVVDGQDAPKAMLKRLRELELTVAELADTLDSAITRLKTANARSAMRMAREGKLAGNGPDGLPDPAKDPEGWRAAVSARAFNARMSAGLKGHK